MAMEKTREQRAAQLVLERRRAVEKLTRYIEYLRPEQLPDFHYEPAAHHVVIANELDRQADALWHRTEQDDRLAISLPPGSAKSLYADIINPTRLLAMNPAWKILTLCAGESLAEDFARRRRQIMKTERWQRLSGSYLLPDAQSLEFQGTPQGGGIYSYGAGSTIQGLRADALVGDDLVKGHEMAGSLSQLDKLWNWYVSEARERLRPGGIETLIATRWHILDPIGRVLRLTEDGHEQWRYVRIPHVCDSEDDPIGRQIGERLWPEYFTLRKMRDAQRNPLFWNTLHQQNPAVTEHAWVGLEHIHIVQPSEIPKRLRYYIGVDVALKVGAGDFTVFAVWGIDTDGIWWLIDLYRKQSDIEESARSFIAWAAQWQSQGLRTAWYENDNQSVTWARLVMIEARRQGIGIPLRMSKIKNQDKEVRNANLRSLFLQDRVRIVDREYTQALIREIAEFPDGRNDDIVDGMGVVAKELHQLAGPKPLPDLNAPKPEILGAMLMENGQIKTRQNLNELFKTLNVGGRRGRI